MSTDVITGIIAAVVPLIGAITALIYAIKARRAAVVATGIAANAKGAITAHVVGDHNMFPIQPPTETETPLK